MLTCYAVVLVAAMRTHKKQDSANYACLQALLSKIGLAIKTGLAIKHG